MPKVINIVPEVGDAGKTTVYVRGYDPERDTKVEGQDPLPYVAISTRCAHLGCPVRYIQASQKFVCPCHGGVYGFEGQVEGGPPVRPLDRFYTRVDDGRVRSASASRSTRARALPAPARPVEPPRRALAVPVPVEADHMKPRCPRPCARRPTRPGPERRERRERRNGAPPPSRCQGHARRGRRHASIGWLDERTGASPFLRGFLYRKVPKGTNWYYTLGSATMFASSRRRSPASSWPCTTSRTRRAPTVGVAHHHRRLPRRVVRGMHSGATG